MYEYRWIDLVTRHIDCSTITVEEFVKAMFSDFLEAQEKYDELYSAMQEFDKLMRDNGLNITAEDIWSDYVEGV